MNRECGKGKIICRRNINKENGAGQVQVMKEGKKNGRE